MVDREALNDALLDAADAVPLEQMSNDDIAELLIVLLRIRRRIADAENHPTRGLRVVR
ncbi:hypothetical protein [uncultured Gordonia sp.]|uniref:hypothetical protein n=1 Tax=uncultured Gordonia sp. TaxID=198437 RepID=UPI00258D1B29|nr:hypothetical protein [uncultured Gordonia sp.]